MVVNALLDAIDLLRPARLQRMVLKPLQPKYKPELEPQPWRCAEAVVHTETIFAPAHEERRGKTTS